MMSIASQTTAAAPAPDSPAPIPPPLGPDSLTWECFGDLRGLLLIGRAGILQNMHPAIGAGVEQHSDYSSNPWNRLLRSAPPILGVVYDGGAARATGASVRDYHREIKGVDGNGRRYHALQPDVYYWAHATFFESQIVMRERFGTPLTAAEQEQLYRESIDWYAQYGVSMRPVPPDYAAFRAYWDRTVEERLEPTQPVRWSLDRARLKDVDRPYESIPRPLWRLVRPLVMGGSMWVAAGTLPPTARERLGLRWTARDERLLRLLALVTRATFRLLPHDLRYMPRARRGWKRIRAR
ncbi:MAG TPA: oxygenase MpaB family protein [Conexibacter sp.]|nr:oxygenase MpaB family protein [Conexibacter sp.]